MSSPENLSLLKPQDGWAEVTGFTEDGPLKDLLMSFGVIPGVRLQCVRRVPGSTSLVLDFESWQGALRENEAAIVTIKSVPDKSAGGVT